MLFFFFFSFYSCFQWGMGYFALSPCLLQGNCLAFILWKTIFFDCMKEEIATYLKGPRPYREGIALYDKYGRNLMLKATFRRSAETALTRATLMEELRKLAGIGEQEFKNLPRLACAAPDNIPAPEIPAGGSGTGNVPVSPATENAVRFRERFPFLNSADCPDILKILVADMFTAYDGYLKAHRELSGLPDDADEGQAFAVAKDAVENYLEDRAIWEELEHYRDNHVLLGRHPRVAASLLAGSLTEKSDLEVVGVRKNAASNVSKWKKKLEEAQDEAGKNEARKKLEEWEARKAAADMELEVRKKN